LKPSGNGARRGRVVAVGAHTDLMKTNELYRALLSQEYEASKAQSA